MPTTQELREQRANIWEQMKEINEVAQRETRDLTAEEQQKWDRADKDLDDLANKITRQEKFETRQAQMSQVDRSELNHRGSVQLSDEEADDFVERFNNTAAYKKAFGSWVREGSLDMNADERKLLQEGALSNTDLRDIKQALGVGTNTAGGYTVPLEFRNVLIETMKAIGSVRAVADHIQTDSGVALPWPTVDDTSNVGAILAENAQVSQQDVVFGTNSLNAYMYTSKLVLVSLQLLNDAGFAVNTWLPQALGRRIGRIQNQHFTTGTGTSQPLGLVTGGTVGKTGATGQTSTIIYDDLIDLIDSIDPAYLSGDLSWMIGQPFRRVIRKLKDSQNRPLWEPSLQVGTPDSLLGYGIVLNNDMPAPAANAKPLAFGDFKQGYVVRDVTDLSVLRLTERYADFLQVGFLAFERSDGTVQNAAAYRLYQNSAT